MWLIVLFISLAVISIGVLILGKTPKSKLTGDPIKDARPLTRVAKRIKKEYFKKR